MDFLFYRESCKNNHFALLLFEIVNRLSIFFPALLLLFLHYY